MGITEQLKLRIPFTTTTKRTGIYVAAKRLNITIKTDKVSETETRVSFVDSVKSKLDVAIDTVKGLPVADRLVLFDKFELCCGMNRGACICPAEVIEVKSVPVPAKTSGPFTDVASFLAAKQKPGREPITKDIEQVSDTWHFTKNDPVEYADNGRCYRRQYLTSNPKYRRSVEVDCDDLDKIINENPRR